MKLFKLKTSLIYYKKKKKTKFIKKKNEILDKQFNF